MLSDQISKSAVRIFDTKTSVVGCGFFFAGSVLTCAHVINQALRVSFTSTKKPTDSVNFDFPLLNSGTMLEGRVATWLPAADIASLEIVSSLPENLRSTRFIKATDLWGHSFRAYGFPRGLDEGVWASGKILHSVSNGWLEIEDLKQTGFFVQPGFSGGAVWDEQYQGIVGMVIGAHANPSSRVAYIVPITKFMEYFPKLDENSIDPIDDNVHKIRELISLGFYSEAYKKCRDTLVIDPHHPAINFLSVIALMKGKGADRLQANVVMRVEEHLRTVYNSPKAKSTALVILGIVKYDHYVVNGLDEGTPSVDEIKRNLHQTDLGEVDKDLISLIKASKGALSYLGLR
jgi:hypothetical protein